MRRASADCQTQAPARRPRPHRATGAGAAGGAAAAAARDKGRQDAHRRRALARARARCAEIAGRSGRLPTACARRCSTSRPRLWRPGVIGARVLADFFAGTGALGIEALPRGAAFALFVDDAAEARALAVRRTSPRSGSPASPAFRRDAAKLGAAPARTVLARLSRPALRARPGGAGARRRTRGRMASRTMRSSSWRRRPRPASPRPRASTSPSGVTTTTARSSCCGIGVSMPPRVPGERSETPISGLPEIGKQRASQVKLDLRDPGVVNKKERLVAWVLARTFAHCRARPDPSGARLAGTRACVHAHINPRDAARLDRRCPFVDFRAQQLREMLGRAVPAAAPSAPPPCGGRAPGCPARRSRRR